MDEMINLLPTIESINLYDLYYVSKNFGFFDPINNWNDYDDIDKVEFIMELEKYKGIQIHDIIGDHILDNGWQLILQYVRDIKIDNLLNEKK